MRIGIAYDTQDTYSSQDVNEQHYDFASDSEVMALKNAITEAGFDVCLLGNAQEILEILKKQGNIGCDLVFNIAEGISSRNREALVPALLEIAHIPYIGTDAYGLSLTLDKHLSKLIAAEEGVLTPKSRYIIPGTAIESIRYSVEGLQLPIMVKPNSEGNSTGITRCKTHPKTVEAVCKILNSFGTPVLCEEFIPGKEITVPIIGDGINENKLFGITGVDIQNDRDDFWLATEQKLRADYNNLLVSEPEERVEEYKEITQRLFLALGCTDFARFDFRETADGRIYFIEANPLPSLYENGSFAVVGEAAGYSFCQTIKLIIDTACARLQPLFPKSKLS